MPSNCIESAHSTAKSMISASIWDACSGSGVEPSRDVVRIPTTAFPALADAWSRDKSWLTSEAGSSIVMRSTPDWPSSRSDCNLVSSVGDPINARMGLVRFACGRIPSACA